MSQHDLDLANQSGSSFRADANSALKALASMSKGASRPTGVQTGQLWVEDDAPSAAIWTLWIYDGTNDVCLGYFNTTNDIFVSPAKIHLATPTITSGVMPIGTVYADMLQSSGTTTITGLGTAPAGTRREIWHTAAQQYTYNATSLITPGAANYTTVAGDVLTWYTPDGTNWRCIDRYSIASAVGTITGVTAGTGLTGGGTSGGVTLTVANPIRVRATWTGSTGAILSSSGMTSVTRTAAGRYTLAFSVTFADANWAWAHGVNVASVGAAIYGLVVLTKSTTGATVATGGTSSSGVTDWVSFDYATTSFMAVG